MSIFIIFFQWLVLNLGLFNWSLPFSLFTWFLCKWMMFRFLWFICWILDDECWILNENRFWPWGRWFIRNFFRCITRIFATSFNNFHHLLSVKDFGCRGNSLFIGYKCIKFQFSCFVCELLLSRKNIAITTIILVNQWFATLLTPIWLRHVLFSALHSNKWRLDAHTFMNKE